MRHDRRNSPPRPIAFCNAGGRWGALPSDLRCNFSVSSTAPLPESVGLTACGLLRLIVSNFEEPVLFSRSLWRLPLQFMFLLLLPAPA